MIRYFLDKIFEPNGQLKSNPRIRLPSGPTLMFDSMFERVKIIRLLVASRIPPGYREESTDLQDEIGSVTEDLGHRSDRSGDLDIYDDDFDIFDDEHGVPNFRASEVEDDDEGYETKTSCSKSDHIDRWYDRSSKSPEENRTRSTTSMKLEVMVDEDDESLAGLPRTLDPGHHLEILLTLLNHLANPKGLPNGLVIRYERFLESYGSHNIEDEMLQALEADIRNLPDQKYIDLQKLKACTKGDAKACNRMGAYMHVMYDPNNSDVSGAYIGTSTCISDWIKAHIVTTGNPTKSKEGPPL